MKTWNSIFAGAILVGVTIGSNQSHGATFTPIGDLEGGTFSSQPRDVSNDGKVVVGFSRATAGNEAFRWTQSTGIVGLGDLAGGSYDSRAHGVSADGSVVVGHGVKVGPANEAFRWTAEDGLVGLGDLPGEPFSSQARGVSADGNVVVGESVMSTPIGGPNIHAFRWTAASNSMTDLGTLFANNAFASIANAVSGDGAAVVGWGNSTPGNQAFRWTQATGMVGLGDLDGGAYTSEAFAVSFDGSVVVGNSTSGNGTEAFRWTQATGMVGLGDLTGGSFFSSARAVSADGSIVVGYGAPSNILRATIWDPVNGIRNLQDVLTNEYGLGAALTDWTLHEASAISADGNHIVGYATNPTGGTEGWLVNLAPSSPTLDGDYNGDEIVDAGDYTVWRDSIGSTNLAADGNNDGFVNDSDYDVWKSNYGMSAGGGANANAVVPEPASVALLGLVAVLVSARPSRKQR